MSENVPAILSWHLFTDCPKCGDQIDLSSPENDSEGYVPTCIFSNAWDNLKGHEVECACGHTFEIEVEY